MEKVFGGGAVYLLLQEGGRATGELATDAFPGIPIGDLTLHEDSRSNSGSNQ
jgi:hypothetical protein